VVTLPVADRCRQLLPTVPFLFALRSDRVTGERNEFPFFMECEPAVYARGRPTAKWVVSPLDLMAPVTAHPGEL
jgi:hypothetical protein